MPDKLRPEIHIPDHEVLRKIGGGAYGEVWMARGVTGALRAVKVVWREDFEDERGFEREFEGILKFEPISRDHPGLVNILHVGRSPNDDQPFYFYVMELGDDRHTGREINPVEYEARTLRSDLEASAGKPLDTSLCLDVALKLAEGLENLHGKGLAHRDVKPANIIFVDGKAKLADIGLVATRGQQTFVGTEGFVPPEGPGSAQADVYSLGKVLYEMATGKDRLQFPELPDQLPANGDRKQWLALNQMICSICEPKLSKRTLNTAKQVVQAVARIQQGKKLRQKRAATKIKVAAAAFLLGGGSYSLWHYQPWKSAPTPDPPRTIVGSNDPDANADKPLKYKNQYCAVQLTSLEPLDDVKVYANGILVDEKLPTDFMQHEPGTTVSYRIEAEGYKDFEKDFIIPDEPAKPFRIHLETFQPPKENEVWVDAQGVKYFPRLGFHESDLVKESDFKAYIAALESKPQYQASDYSEKGNPVRIVFLNKQVASDYALWIEEASKVKGLLHTDQYVTYVFEKELKVGTLEQMASRERAEQYPLRLIAKKIPYAKLTVNTIPTDAKVKINGREWGDTPFVIDKFRPGKLTLEFSKEGFKPHVETIELTDNEHRPVLVRLKENNSVIFGKKWNNGLGVPLMPLADGKMAAVWEVRVKDYTQFIKETGHRPFEDPGFEQGPNHPIVGVTRDDAAAFCKWLTEKERKEERLSPNHRYRLPTDVEWSLMCGLENEGGVAPVNRAANAALNKTMQDLYPWGKVFPPKDRTANLADITAMKAGAFNSRRIIKDYTDGFVNTAPVGSYEPNELGLFDLSGNVFEFVSDDQELGVENPYAVARGGSWASRLPSDLKTWHRLGLGPQVRDNQYGFRYILVDESEDEETEDGEDAVDEEGNGE